MKKTVQRMWSVYDVLFFEREKAEAVRDGREKVKEVFVGINEDEIELERNGISADYFGSWIFLKEKEAKQEVNEFNLV